jgi:large repetitive protein
VPPGGTNTVNVTTTSTDTDPANNTDSVSLSIVALGAPATGFAPDRLTRLPAQTQYEVYSEYRDLWLEVPLLGVESSIVGVPLDADGWDVTWLGDQVGYLAGTAFPTWRGNSVMTGHVTLSSGLPGPFARLEDLGYGARVIVHGWGTRYIYEVREVDVVRPDDPSVFQHEERSWITLMTCQGYDERTGSYRWRRLARAVLTLVETDGGFAGPDPGGARND